MGAKKKQKKEEHFQRTREYFNAIARGLHDLSSTALQRGAGEYLLSSLYNQATGNKKSEKAFVEAIRDVVCNSGKTFQKTPPIVGQFPPRPDGSPGKTYEIPGSPETACHPLVRKAVLDFAKTRGIGLEKGLMPINFINMTVLGSKLDGCFECRLPDDERRSWSDREKDRKIFEAAFFDYHRE